MNITNFEIEISQKNQKKKIVNLWKTLRKNIEKDNILEKIIDKLSLDRDNKPKQLHQEFLFRKLIK